MIDWSDNGGYLLLGLAVFWVPTVGYWLWMRVRARRAAEEELLIREELNQLR